MKKYIIKKTGKTDDADFEFISEYPWDYDYKPEACFKITHSDNELSVLLRAYEKNPVARITQKHGPVCNDSCMEFFFTVPEDGKNRYFNFEVNANPTYLFDYGDLESREHVECDDSDLKLVSSRGCDDEKGEYWQINFSVPYTLIKKYVKNCRLDSGCVIRGNVYKCGCTDQPAHYGSWSLVDTSGPNFHTPQFFGEFVLE